MNHKHRKAFKKYVLEMLSGNGKNHELPFPFLFTGKKKYQRYFEMFEQSRDPLFSPESVGKMYYTHPFGESDAHVNRWVVVNQTKQSLEERIKTFQHTVFSSVFFLNSLPIALKIWEVDEWYGGGKEPARAVFYEVVFDGISLFFAQIRLIVSAEQSCYEEMTAWFKFLRDVFCLEIESEKKNAHDYWMAHETHFMCA